MEIIEKKVTQPLKISYEAKQEDLKNPKKEMIWLRVRTKLLRAWVYTTDLAIDDKKGNIVNETNEIEFGLLDKSKKIKWLKCYTDKIEDGFNSESEEKKLIHKIRKKIVAYALVLITISILYGFRYSYVGVMDYLPVLAFLFSIDLVIIVLKLRGLSLPNINNLLAKKKLLPKGER